MLYIDFIPERVPELYQNRVWKRWTQWDALLRPYQLREALNGGGFDAALDVEIVLRHVYLRVTGKDKPNALAMRLNVRAAKLKTIRNTLREHASSRGTNNLAHKDFARGVTTVTAVTAKTRAAAF